MCIRDRVNGRSGEVQGERPYSPWKIAFAILLGLLLLGGGIAAWQHYEEGARSRPQFDYRPRLGANPRECGGNAIDAVCGLPVAWGRSSVARSVG